MITKKLWLWFFEFRLRRVRDAGKIEFLAKELLKEVEAQGYNLKSTNDLYGLSLNIFTSDNSLIISNILANWKTDGGKYSPVMEVKQ